MKLAIDIDNTLADLNPALRERFGERGKGEYFYPGADEDFFRNNPDFFLGARVIPGAVSGMSRLAARHELCYLTRRPMEAREQTREWLLSNGFPKCPVYHVNDKGEAARELGIELAIDDAVEDVLSLLQAGIRVWVVPYEYNMVLTQPHFAWEMAG